ncbi:MAG: type VI secretion system tip protein VgrG [Chitinophagaceae bacterium]|nr:MAG: type VI secretion system tip protein VgrG [Chitinophagaceae bacterium]
MPVKSPIDIEDPTLRLIIKTGGEVIKDYYPVISVYILQEVNRISSAEIIFADKFENANELPISDSEDFIPGNELEILAGYGNDDARTIFKGIIVRQSLRLSTSGGVNLVVTCRHKAVMMTFNRKEKQYENKTDSDIISEVIAGYGLSCTIDATSSQQEISFQKSATDWDFILSRAEFYGYITVLDDEKIIMGKPKFNEEPLLRVTLGESIISFNAELNAEKQAPSIDASAWDPKNQEILQSQSTEPAMNAQGNLDAKSLSGKLNQSKLSLSSVTPMSQEDLKTWADGRLLTMRLNALKGQVTFIGNADIKAGGMIELEGVGKRFSGKAFVSSVTHTIEDGTWNTSAKFGLDYKPIYEQTNFSYPAATGQLPAAHGLQIGTVEKIFADDAATKLKVLVKLPSNTEEKNSVWARIANFYATSGAGAFFLPEVGDEVIIGFLENDPRYPIVLGSVYSNSKQPAAEVKDNNNYIKSLTTKSNLKITFDDEKKITTIETPAGNTITLNDDTKIIEVKDQNSNSIKLSSDGIDMQSDKDINVKAKGNITLDATGNLKLSATQDVSVSGMNIKNEAKTGFTAKGNATAEISASGQTVVKGGIVMIN